MERIKETEIINWYNNKRRKPLVVWGARQVGKTYLVKNLFAKKHFRDYVYIDLKKDDDACRFFSQTANCDTYLSYIETRYGKRISNNTPLIFDEVQQCHQVLSALKYFCQDHPELPVIATGSMVRLSIRQHKDGLNSGFLFPVGNIDSMYIYPLTFEEYLINTNPVLKGKIEEAYVSKHPLKDYEHNLAMNLLHEFLTIGGLPEALNVFLEERSYVEASKVIKSVYSNYLSDMDTYNISAETILKTRNIYKNIFAQLNKGNKNFKISIIEKGKSNRDYFNAYQWLELAHITYRCRKLTGKVTLPLMEKDEGLFRLYLADEGLFAYQSNVNQSNFFVSEKRNTLSGIFYENYVADEFMAKGIPLYYWVGKQTHEFEFIVENNGLAIPIDVKKGSGKLNSLEDFRSTNPKGLAIKICNGNFGYDACNQILTIPHYATFLLGNDLAEGKIIGI